MLGKCTNPSCSVSFRYMEEGILFRLEADPAVGLFNRRKPEYYWLCRNCSAAMTLHISTEGKVIPVALPAPADVQSATVSDFILPKRENGLMLSGVYFSTKRHRRRKGKGYPA